MLIKTKKEKTDYDLGVLAARTQRKHADQLKGLSKPKGAQRGDYKLCDKLNKTIADYRKFKDSKDREKINNEYYGMQKEERKYG